MRIHFIGIGGIGISGLAQFMNFKGHIISGSDVKENKIIKKLRLQGIKINTPHSIEAITDDLELIVYSAAIPNTNIEILEGTNQNIKIVTRSEALPIILNGSKVYSIAGAHGKSTTTAILSSIIKGSSIIGAESKEFNSNVRFEDDNNTLLFEADESDGSFMNTNPYCAIVINAEPEHMEFYNYDYDRFYNSYIHFIKSAKIRILNGEDPFLKTLIGKIEAKWIYPSKDIINIKYELINNEPYTMFDLINYGSFKVYGIGEHIALDASLAILASEDIMPIEDIKEKLLLFKGIKKRFDIVYSKKDSIIIDDYGHHPTEISATLKAINIYSNLNGFKEFSIVWQPHKYSRTIDNIEEYVECFKGVKNLVILPVWGVNETKQNIDFKGKFRQYNPIIADKVKREKGCLNIIKKGINIGKIEEGIIIGFGAGNITSQMRVD